jgi:hypothetical protein
MVLKNNVFFNELHSSYLCCGAVLESFKNDSVIIQFFLWKAVSSEALMEKSKTKGTALG